MTRRFLPFAVLLLALAAALPLAPSVAQTRAPATTSASAFTE